MESAAHVEVQCLIEQRLATDLARRILQGFLNQQLLTADSEKGSVRLALPAKHTGYSFPRLYPEGVEMA